MSAPYGRFSMRVKLAAMVIGIARRARSKPPGLLAGQWAFDLLGSGFLAATPATVVGVEFAQSVQ